MKLYDIALFLEDSPFELFTKPYSMNLGAIRNFDDLQSNSFNDLAYIFYFDEIGQLFGHIAPCTTDPGLYYRENPMNVDGTAIIVGDRQYRSVYKLQDNGHKGYRAWRQIKPMTYIRDTDENATLNIARTFMPQFHVEELALTNLHHAGTNSTQVDKWSAGCIVIGSMTDWDEFISIGNLQEEKGLGDVFSFTLINSISIEDYET